MLGYLFRDMDIIPTDLATYAGEAKNILRDLQSRNERMFLMTFLVVNFADSKQKLEHLQNYIDYEAYGRDVALEENGTFTDQGYVRDTGESFHEYYDGERGSIPDEYRVMTFQDDLPEEEKSEWAMDIAFDMDEFFRQNDPQYAAEHPEAHAAKEELYENLMAGRISTLDEKLAALGQTQEDYLPSEIEKFKDATGYEEFLDFDPAEVKAALDDPDKSHADEMLSAAERAASEKMTVLVVEPMKEPYVKEIGPDLHSLQIGRASCRERV